VMGTGREYLVHYASIAVCFVLGIIEWILFRQGRQKLAMILAVLEVGGYSAFMQNCFFHDVVFDDYRLASEGFAYLLDTDEDLLFRLYIPIDDVIPGYPNLNSSLRYGYLSERTYNSLYDTATNAFLSLMGISEHRIDITDPDALNLLGTKYYLVTDTSQLPDAEGFEYVTTLEDSLQVYRNRSFYGFGWAGKSVGIFSDDLSVHDLSQAVYLDQPGDVSTYEHCSFAPFHTEIKTTNYLRGTISLAEDNILFLPIPFNKGWKVTADGMPVNAVSVNGGFLGIPLTAGDHAVELNFMSPGLKEGILCTGAGGICFLYLLFKKRKQHQ